MVSLSRYVLRQHLLPFVLGFALIVFVLVIDVVLQMLDQVLSKGLGAETAVVLFVYNLAWIVALAVPMAVLIAVLMAFGRMAEDGEILALKACGISFTRLVAPALLSGAVLSVVMIWFNDRVLPDWNHRARNLAAELKRRKAALVLRQKEGVFIRNLGDYSLLVRKVDETKNKLHDITLYDTGRPGPPTTLRAARGKLEIFDGGHYVRLELEDGEVNRVNDSDLSRFSRGSFSRQVIHIEDPDRSFTTYRSAYRSDREMNVSTMLRAVDEHEIETAQTKATMDSTVNAFLSDALNDSIEIPSLARRGERLASRLDKQWRILHSRERRRNSYLVEVHKKFSIASACLVFVLLGAPVGSFVRSRGAAVAVAVSLVFFFAYWMFLIGGEELADRGFVAPAVAMWAPNTVFGGLGLLLLRAATLDRSFPLIGDRLLRRPRWPGPAQ
ncbi:MAG: LptF/LptG family permease [Candidatus Latescibacterota bacterium]|nr:LptF/LptG family permease [Candidatus Latescibacterota bacterium]